MGSFQTFEADGTWYVETASKRQLEDGTVAITHARQGPYDWGTYTVDGSMVTLDNAAETECPSTHGVYTVSFVDADTVRWELIEDDCPSRMANIVKEEHKRVEVLSSDG